MHYHLYMYKHTFKRTESILGSFKITEIKVIKRGFQLGDSKTVSFNHSQTTAHEQKVLSEWLCDWGSRFINYVFSNFDVPYSDIKWLQIFDSCITLKRHVHGSQIAAKRRYIVCNRTKNASYSQKLSWFSHQTSEIL